VSQENMEIVRAGFEAFNRGDIDQLLAVMSEDCEWRPPAYAVEGTSYVGHDRYAAWFEGLRERWSSMSFTPTLSDAGEHHVVAAVEAEFVGRTSGVPVEQRFWIVYWLAGGRIVRMHSFPTEADALEAVALPFGS
jgi:uncharacterized protein